MIKLKKQERNISLLWFCLLIILSIILSDYNLAYAKGYTALNIAITPGSSASKLNFNWYSTQDDKGIIEVTKKHSNDYEFSKNSTKTYYATEYETSSGYYSNKVTVKNLLPDTEYIYRLGDGMGNWSESYSFKTGKLEEFDFLAVGDPQIGAKNTAIDTANWDNTLTKAKAKFPDTSFIISAGDQVNINNSENQFKGLLAPDELRSVPISPALGNHDNGADNTEDHFNLPNLSSECGITLPGLANYYYNYGNALIMVLNSNSKKLNTHDEFIRNTINSNPDVVWKIVVLHHDIYGSGTHANESQVIKQKNHLYPIFDENKIDVVITGHDHSYTRTHVMKNNKTKANLSYENDGSITDPEGTIYFTLNSATGSKYYSLNSVKKGYEAVRSQINVPTFSRINITENKLKVESYRTDNMKLTDSCSINKTSNNLLMMDKIAQVFLSKNTIFN